MGQKNRLVHPELWVGHFGRFSDLAISQRFEIWEFSWNMERYLLKVTSSLRAKSFHTTKMGSPFGISQAGSPLNYFTENFGIRKYY